MYLNRAHQLAVHPLSIPARSGSHVGVCNDELAEDSEYKAAFKVFSKTPLLIADWAPTFHWGIASTVCRGTSDGPNDAVFRFLLAHSR